MYNLARLRGLTPVNQTQVSANTTSAAQVSSSSSSSVVQSDASFESSSANPVSDDLNRFRNASSQFGGSQSSATGNQGGSGIQSFQPFQMGPIPALPELPPANSAQPPATGRRSGNSQPAAPPSVSPPNMLTSGNGNRAEQMGNAEDNVFNATGVTLDRRSSNLPNNSSIRQRGRGGNDTLNAAITTRDGGSIEQIGDNGQETIGGIRAAASQLTGGDLTRDDFRGDAGDDTLFAESRTDGKVNIDQSSGFGRDSLTALGGGGDDQIRQFAGSDDDTLRANGGAGDDDIRMSGGRGDDQLIYEVSSGRDQVELNGGEGNDRAIIRYSAGQNFTIVDSEGNVLERVGQGGTEILVDGVEDYRLVRQDGQGG